ncbi:ATP-binding cassette, subfamily B [Cohaesibacter sp. ES.047]|uniref:ABC transporter transmembrane domain-containing protein n=1 Tax=Cohaesibacter sp. ES.047 TaxID=1798205 RepID=UPI000BB825F9|nr:ABC transporter transmembrane domain-containing protein [Cohaesibacter sp. ES.047]SNY90957.1 ATP-binding cassette, subfamily B [Cohaesibacter sp. ES.047]
MTDTPVPASARLQPLLRLVPYALRYRSMVIMAIVSLVVASAATLSLPVLVRGLIDQGLSQDNVALVDHYTGWLILAVGFLALSSASRYYFVIILGERVVNDLRRDVFGKLTALSPVFFDRTRSGEIVSRLTADATQIKSAVGASASMALRNFLLFVGAGVMMVVTSPQMSLLVLGAIPFIVLPLVGLGRWVRKKQRFAQDRLADSSAFASEAIGSMRILQAFTQEDRIKGFFGESIEAAFGAARFSIRARAVLTAFAMFCIFASIVGVLWYAAQDVAAGRLSAGALSQFLIYSTMAAAGLGGLSEVWGEISQASGSAERLMELLDEEVVIRTADAPEALPSGVPLSVAFDHVGFHYGKDEAQAVLEDLTFSIDEGETVAIVGPSGAGKTTVFQVLMRFYDATSGVISLGDILVERLSLEALRGSMALVPQEPVIFAMTVADNIAMGRDGASRDEIIAAAKAAHADEFIASLPEGYDTTVGERGVTLSGGQRQRLAIARAILKDAPILLLDEATSALDAESETYVQAALDGMMSGRTTIVIAHRLATVKKADRILVLDRGRLVEEGDHDSLVAQKGLYARLASLQFGDGEE